MVSVFEDTALLSFNFSIFVKMQGMISYFQQHLFVVFVEIHPCAREVEMFVFTHEECGATWKCVSYSDSRAKNCTRDCVIIKLPAENKSTIPAVGSNKSELEIVVYTISPQYNEFW